MTTSESHMEKLNKMVNDATPSLSGTIYQISVALERAFMLQEGQSLWIEKFGDVTISNEIQIETKLYNNDPLTDNHVNFWKTLKNWLSEDFAHENYAYLSLITTQSYGVNSRLLEWNDASQSRRLAILREIAQESEARFIAAKTKTGEALKDPPQSLKYQLYCLDPIRSTVLQEVVAKLDIACDSPDPLALRKRIFDRYGKAILVAKLDSFLDDLMGFLVSPAKMQSGWEITFSEFSAKVAEVTKRYCKGTINFPVIQITPSTEQVNLQTEKLFVRKIHEIEYQEMVPEAIRDYLQASYTVLEEFKKHEVSPIDYEIYSNNLKSTHAGKLRKAKLLLNGADPISASKVFYLEITSQDVQPFSILTATPIAFRNGVLHMLADSDEHEVHWKVW